MGKNCWRTGNNKGRSHSLDYGMSKAKPTSWLNSSRLSQHHHPSLTFLLSKAPTGRRWTPGVGTVAEAAPRVGHSWWRVSSLPSPPAGCAPVHSGGECQVHWNVGPWRRSARLVGSGRSIVISLREEHQLPLIVFRRTIARDVTWVCACAREDV